MRSTFRLTSSPARIESLSLFDSAYRYSTVKFCSLNIAKVTQTLSECLLAGLRAEPSARGQISDPRDFTRPFRLGGKAKCKEYSGQVRQTNLEFIASPGICTFTESPYP